MDREPPEVRSFEQEASNRARFLFGDNWKRFLLCVNDDRVEEARQSLATMLEVTSLSGKSFLDIGSGSGLFSLAARRLGARVTSFDYDPGSVWCTEQLRNRFRPEDPDWHVLRGSILDREFTASLQRHDIVYSWGVLHHTGRMHEAIMSAARLVLPGGLFYLALYRKTWLCPLWKVEKRIYCASPPQIQKAIVHAYMASIGALRRHKHSGEKLPRGMDDETDARDWLGGYPYESITPRELKALLGKLDLTVRKQIVKSEGRHLVPGCDEFLLQRVTTE